MFKTMNLSAAQIAGLPTETQKEVELMREEAVYYDKHTAEEKAAILPFQKEQEGENDEMLYGIALLTIKKTNFQNIIKGYEIALRRAKSDTQKTNFQNIIKGYQIALRRAK